MSDGDRLTLTVPEAAELLGIGRSAAYEAARRGELPVLRIGRKLLVSRSRLLALVDGRPRAEDRSQSAAVGLVPHESDHQASDDRSGGEHE